MENELPPDPMSQLSMASTQLHEAFESFVSAGFTRPEALEFCIEMLRLSWEEDRGGNTSD